MLLKSKIAYLGVLLGLNQIFIILSSIFETNTIILFAAAALIVGVAIVEFGGRYGFIFYIASCITGFFLSFNKIEFLTYVIFFGLYSYIKYIFEYKIKDKTILLTLKLIYFNVALVIMYIIIKLFVHISLAWWMIFIAQILFLLYDYFYSVFINYYIFDIKNKLKR